MFPHGNIIWPSQTHKPRPKVRFNKLSRPLPLEEGSTLSTAQSPSLSPVTHPLCSSWLCACLAGGPPEPGTPRPMWVLSCTNSESSCSDLLVSFFLSPPTPFSRRAKRESPRRTGFQTNTKVKTAKQTQQNPRQKHRQRRSNPSKIRRDIIHSLSLSCYFYFGMPLT